MKDKVDPRDIEKLWQVSATTQSDRELAIVALAYLEDYLGRAIRSKLPGLTSDIRDSLFGVTGSLSAMAARIDLAKALNLIDVHERSDFVTLARIRNRFAHNLHVDSFDHPTISELTQKLRVVNDILAGQGKFQGQGSPPEAFVSNFGANPRGRFALAVNVVAANLHNRLHLVQISARD